MANYPKPIDRSGNMPTRRKDQRFPPRYNKRQSQKPIIGKGVTILTLLKKIGKTQLVNSKYVRIKRVQFNEKKNLYKFTTETFDPETKQKRLHVQRIYPADPNYKGRLTDCPAIKVACSCGFHLFFTEVSLAYHGAADIIYSNGAYPIARNPQLKLWTCKHVFKDFLFIVQNDL